LVELEEVGGFTGKAGYRLTRKLSARAFDVTKVLKGKTACLGRKSNKDFFHGIALGRKDFMFLPMPLVLKHICRRPEIQL
jgi:hypothetical protein